MNCLILSILIYHYQLGIKKHNLSLFIYRHTFFCCCNFLHIFIEYSWYRERELCVLFRPERWDGGFSRLVLWVIEAWILAAFTYFNMLLHENNNLACLVTARVVTCIQPCCNPHSLESFCPTDLKFLGRIRCYVELCIVYPKGFTHSKSKSNKKNKNNKQTKTFFI